MNFVLLSCPHSPDQIQEGRPMLKWLPRKWLPELTGFLQVSVKGGIKGAGFSGCLMNFPLMPGQTRQAEKKAAQAVEKIKTAGARVVGLETGLRNLAPVFAQLGLAVSHGLTLQVASSISLLMNTLAGNSRDIRVLIVNPAAPPGAVCARLLAPKVRHLTLMGNFAPPLQRLAKRILLETGTAPIISGFNPQLVILADLIIDLAGIDLNNLSTADAAVIWQPQSSANYQGPGTLITEVLLGLNIDMQIEGDLPRGILRASTAEAILQGLGVEGIWPRNFREVTVDQVSRIGQMAARIDMPIVGYVNGDKVSILPTPLKI